MLTFCDVAGPVFAALDGAQFDDPAALMKSANINCRSLFLGVADAEREAAGPWLTGIDAMAAMDRFLAILGDLPAAVFWSCPAGEAALYRHLRLLNEAIVPLLRDDALPRAEGEARPAYDFKDTRVLFRHWDPRVLAQVLPVLDEPQFARVLGPAMLAVMPREDGGRPYEAPLLDGAVITRGGPLHLTLEQMDALQERLVHASRLRIASFLKDNVPPMRSRRRKRCGRPFSARAFASVRTRNLNMFTLITMGTGVSWACSVVATLGPAHSGNLGARRRWI